MSVQEISGSRSSHLSRDGQTLTTIFICTWNETVSWANLAKIGMMWSPWRPDLLVSDIVVDPIPNNNTHAKVTCTYSTGSTPWPQNVPDTIASTKNVWDFQASPDTQDEYWDWTADKSQSWETVYQATYPGPPLPPVPPRMTPSSHPTLTIRCNVSLWDWDSIQLKLNHVNSDAFLPTYLKRTAMAQSGVGLVRIENITAELNDIGKWLYIGCHVEQVGRWLGLAPNYEVQHTLLYEPDGWNTIYGVANYKAYRTTLFRGPTGLILPYGYGTDLDNGFRT